MDRRCVVRTEAGHSEGLGEKDEEKGKNVEGLFQG